MSEFLESSPSSVTISSVYQQANMFPGDKTWPILQNQVYVSPNMFWNIHKVAGSNSHFYIQDVQNKYLAPGGERNSCILSDKEFAWHIVQCGGDNVNPVKLYNISEPSRPENLLQSGYRFADPPNAYAVLSQKADPKYALCSWVIEKKVN